jgi:hypothetical protein
MTAVTADHARQADTSFIGHPRGLAWLSAAELWERFSYYGMQALLVLYLTKRLLLPGHVEHVVGFGPFRAAIESIYGPLSRSSGCMPASSMSRRLSAVRSPTVSWDEPMPFRWVPA